MQLALHLAAASRPHKKGTKRQRRDVTPKNANREVINPMSTTGTHGGDNRRRAGQVNR